MSAENAPAPEPAKPTPKVTRHILNAENISHFTPKSIEDEQAALAVENAPFKLINKRRLAREALLSMRINYGPHNNPDILSHEELNNLPIDTLHDHITQYIPEKRESETEFDEQYLDNASNRDLESVIEYYANELDAHLTPYRKKNRRNRAGQNAWTRAIDEQENGHAKDPKDVVEKLKRAAAQSTLPYSPEEAEAIIEEAGPFNLSTGEDAVLKALTIIEKRNAYNARQAEKAKKNAEAKKPAPKTPTPAPKKAPTPATVAAAAQKKPTPVAPTTPTPAPEPKPAEVTPKTPEKKKPKSRTLAGADWAIQQVMRENAAKKNPA